LTFAAISKLCTHRADTAAPAELIGYLSLGCFGLSCQEQFSSMIDRSSPPPAISTHLLVDISKLALWTLITDETRLPAGADGVMPSSLTKPPELQA
jgi:hypothetical protein